MNTLQIPLRAKLTSPRDNYRLYMRTLFARLRHRPENGFLLDTPQPKLPRQFRA